MGNCKSHPDDEKATVNVVGSGIGGRSKFILYSDFTCPYCYLEFVRLRRAMEQLPEEERLPISHGPFQLDDSLPVEGVKKYEFLSSLIPPSALDPMIEDLSNQFRTLNMELDSHGIMGNSAAAHRLQIWAEENCPPEQAIQLKNALFEVHCIIGKSMGDVDALIEAARKVGLHDEGKIRSVLKDSKYASKLKKYKRYAKETLEIQSVPCLMFVEKSGDMRKLEEATSIETVDGFAQLIEDCI